MDMEKSASRFNFFDTAKKIGCIFLDGHSEKKLPFFVKMWN